MSLTRLTECQEITVNSSQPSISSGCIQSRRLHTAYILHTMRPYVYNKRIVYNPIPCKLFTSRVKFRTWKLLSLLDATYRQKLEMPPPWKDLEQLPRYGSRGRNLQVEGEDPYLKIFSNNLACYVTITFLHERKEGRNR